ncbi:MAG: hypothetical protein AVO35_05980 [Candidatus Aegiribacteria sp. MLS_C]|nr:MAG: hypothetical protein AVO35_05980 [Candidatus Aegiribacteria sp. MLS_C]
MTSVLFLLASCSEGDRLVELPEPVPDGGMSVEEAIEARRSVREYSGGTVTLEELSRLLQSAQGITSYRGLRAAPSAGATYPFTIFVVTGNVEDLPAGIYSYDPEGGSLEMKAAGFYLDELASASLGQQCIASAALTVVMAADYSVTTSVYGERGIMYVHMEAGHISQNIYLQATAMGLGTVAVGAFDEAEVRELLELEQGLTPLYLMPVGRT